MRMLKMLLVATVLGSLYASSAAIAGEVCEPKRGPVVADNADGCVPTAEECATGNYNGVYDGGLDDSRAGVCVGVEGHIVIYLAAKFSSLCGAFYLADAFVIGRDQSYDPNACA